MADTTPPDLSRLGYAQQNNPNLKSSAMSGYFNAIGLLGPEAILAVKTIQELSNCVVTSKAAQWAIYTDPKNRLTVGFLFKASKNGLTNPGTILSCLEQKFS